MKKLKNLTRQQKQFLTKQKLDPEDFKCERDTPDFFVFVNHEGQIFKFPKK